MRGSIAIRRLLFTGALLAALAFAAVPVGASQRSTLAQCRAGDTRACVEHVIQKTGVSGMERTWLLEIPGCESNWNAWAYSPGQVASTPGERAAVWDAGVSSMGTWQFERGTWLGLPSWISRHSVWDPLWASWGAYWLYRHDGDGREWSCTAILGLY